MSEIHAAEPWSMSLLVIDEQAGARAAHYEAWHSMGASLHIEPDLPVALPYVLQPGRFMLVLVPLVNRETGARYADLHEILSRWVAQFSPSHRTRLVLYGAADTVRAASAELRRAESVPLLLELPPVPSARAAERSAQALLALAERAREAHRAGRPSRRRD
jgi:hypothetical protein